MSDNIPFEMQMEIIKKVYDVKSLIRFRSVSKPWKSFIDSSDFVKGYGARHAQPHSRFLSYKSFGFLDEAKYICLVDDDNNETFKVQQQQQQQQEFASFVVSHFLKRYCIVSVVGACHGLMCLFGHHKDYNGSMLVIWNPSIGKSFGIVLGNFYGLVIGFGVCPVSRDPTVVKILYMYGKPWHVEVFTLSSRVWNVIPTDNLPRQSIRLSQSSQVVIDSFIYWAAIEYEENFDEDGESTKNHMVVSFDLITKEFKVVDLPDTLTNELDGDEDLFVSKLRESLVVYGTINVEGAKCCGIWVMEHDLSFRKLFSIDARASKILGFTKNGETIFETRNEEGRFSVYDPCSQQIKNLGISGIRNSFFMGSYKESLLLLDHSDLHI